MSEVSGDDCTRVMQSSRKSVRDYRTKPVFAAMHGPHSLVLIGPGCVDHA